MWEHVIIRTILSAWNQVLPRLLHDAPTRYEEYLRQRLIWNLHFITSDGLMLGSRHWLAWEEMVEGPRNSIRTWQIFLSRPWHEQKHVLAVIHGGQIMHWQIQEPMDRTTILALASYG